jgi:hypothetical protein
MDPLAFRCFKAIADAARRAANTGRVMSQEDAENLKRCVELFGQGEMEAALQYVDRGIETIEGAELPDATTYFGPVQADGGLRPLGGPMG